MSRAEDQLATIGGRAHGIICLDEVRAAGITLRALDHHAETGVIVRLGRGVWRLRDHPFDFLSRCRAALALAGPGAALGRRTAGRLHGCYAYRDCEEIEVVVPRGRDHRTSIGTLIESGWLPADHVTEVEGLPTTTLARTFFDLCGDPDHGLSLRHPHHERRMKQLYNDCLARRGMTFTMAVAVLSVLARRGRRGTRLVRSILRQYGAKHRPTQSDVETIFLELVRSRGLPEPECQAVISGEHGWIATVDFAWRRAHLVVEVDSSWHDGPLDEEADQQRDRNLVAAGYTVKRYRFGAIVFEPDRLIRELAAAIDAMA